MTTQEVAKATGIAESTVLKYAKILDITHLGTGYRKIYNWKKRDVERLIITMEAAKPGRPNKENPVRPRKSTRKIKVKPK